MQTKKVTHFFLCVVDNVIGGLAACNSMKIPKAAKTKNTAEAIPGKGDRFSS